MKETRIYLDDKLISIGYNPFTTGCNLINFIKKYGEKRITTKECDSQLLDKEKLEFLNTLNEESGKL